MANAQRARNFATLFQLKSSLAILNQIITNMPPIAPPYISDTTQSEKILTNGFVLLLNNGLSLLWIQLLPHQMEKEVNMKKRFAAIISILLYRP